MNAQGVIYHDKSFPENVSRVFPDSMKNKTSNGSITFQVGENAIKKGMDLPLS
jgi:hypothetical protein